MQGNERCPHALATEEIRRQVWACLNHATVNTDNEDRRNIFLKVKGSAVLYQAPARTARKRAAESEQSLEATCTFRTTTDASHVLRALIAELTCVASSPSTVERALSAVELRNLRLCARDLSTGSGTETAATLTTILFDERMPWLLTPPPSTGLRLGTLSSLTLLDLECNPLHDDGMQALCDDILPRLPNLRRLHLASTEMTASGLYPLVETLCGVQAGARPLLCPEIAVIGLTNNALDISEEAKVGNTSVGELLARLMMAHCRTIQRLHLNHAGLSTHDVASLLAMLVSEPPSAFPQLDTIYLRQNSRIDAANLRQVLRAVCEQRVDELLGKHVRL